MPKVDIPAVTLSAGVVTPVNSNEVWGYTLSFVLEINNRGTRRSLTNIYLALAGAAHDERQRIDGPFWARVGKSTYNVTKLISGGAMFVPGYPPGTFGISGDIVRIKTSESNVDVSASFIPNQ